MVRSGDVVADRCRRPRPAEHGAGVAHEWQQRLGLGGHELEMLRGDGVGDGHRLLRRVAHHGVATFPPRRGGTHSTSSGTPATRAGTAVMSTVDGYDARPPGT